MGGRCRAAKPVIRARSIPILAGGLLLLSACELSGRHGHDISSQPLQQPTTETAAGHDDSAESFGRVSSGLDDAETDGARPQGKIVYGSGQFTRSTVASRTVEYTPEGDIAFSFVDANIREVARVVLGDIFGVNYIVDPEVQGTITLEATRPMPRDAVLEALEVALGANGAALVQGDGLYHIVPLAKAPANARPARVYPGETPPGEGYGIQIVPLQFVSAENMRELLEPIVTADTVVRADAGRNLLIIGAPRGEAKSINETIAMLDVDWLAGMSFGYFPVNYTDAQSMADELSAVLDADGVGPVAELIRVLPLERLNMVLVISPQSRYVEYAAEWIRQLDQAGDDGTRRLFVYYVENTKATDLAEVLNQLFAQQSRTAGTTRGEVAPNLEAVRLKGSTLGINSAAADETAAAVDEAEPSVPQTAFGPSRSESPALDVDASQNIRVIADEANNALVILATKSEFRFMREALARLDLVPLQVLIEATIMEVRLDDELKYGVEWFFQEGNFAGTFSSLASSAVTSAFPGFSFLYTGGSNARAVLNALDSVTDVNVISSPHLLVLNNRSAELQVGDQVPVATQSATSVIDPDSPIVNTIQFFDTGVILRVTPHVSPGGLITLEIDQEVSDAVPTTTSGIDSPTIQQRRITSTVAVNSGDTIALGGLIRDRETTDDTGVPVLKDIPIIGSLFGVTADSKERTELIVLLTPRAVRNQREALAATEELQQRMRRLEPLKAKIE